MEYLNPYSTVGSGEGSRCTYPTRLDVYGCGCSHNCAYCYARSILEFRGNWHPYVPELVDLDYLRDRTGCGKVLVEFLRINGNIKKVLQGLDFSPYRLKLGGYRHLPLKTKRAWLQPVLDRFDEVSICEDVYSHWSVWRDTVNPNPDDCCNLRFA